MTQKEKDQITNQVFAFARKQRNMADLTKERVEIDIFNHQQEEETNNLKN